MVLAVLLFAYLFYAEGGWAFDQLFWSWLFRYLHVLSGIMWIGLLWYLNFVQIPSMPKFTDEQKPAITAFFKHLGFSSGAHSTIPKAFF